MQFLYCNIHLDLDKQIHPTRQTDLTLTSDLISVYVSLYINNISIYVSIYITLYRQIHRQIYYIEIQIDRRIQKTNVDNQRTLDKICSSAVSAVGSFLPFIFSTVFFVHSCPSCSVFIHIHNVHCSSISIMFSVHPYPQCSVFIHILCVQCLSKSIVFCVHPYPQCLVFIQIHSVLCSAISNVQLCSAVSIVFSVQPYS